MMSFDELHQRTFFVSSAMLSGILAALLSGPPLSFAAPRYVERPIGDKRCLVDANSGTLEPSADGLPICRGRIHSRG